MTSNNLEAIELLKTCVERLQDQGFSSHGNTVSELNKAIDLLQADEDIEVKEHACLCKEDNCPNCELIGCKHKKPTKETKLEAIKERLQLMDSPRPEVLYLRDEVIRITNILAKEEY